MSETIPPKEAESALPLADDSGGGEGVEKKHVTKSSGA